MKHPVHRLEVIYKSESPSLDHPPVVATEPKPATLGTITSGRKHSIRSAALYEDRYITCEDNEKTG